MVDAEITGDCNTPPQDDTPCINNDEGRKDDSEIEVLSQTFLQDENAEMEIPPSTSTTTSEKEKHSTLASVLDAEVKSLQLDDVKSQQSDLPSLADSSEATEESCLDSYSRSLSSTSKDKNGICDDAMESFEPFLDDNAADSKIEEDPILSLKGHSSIGSSLETTHTSNVHEVTWKSKEAAHGSESFHTILSVDTTESVHASENVHTRETAHTTDVIIHTSESTQPSDVIAPPDGAQEYDCSTACMLCVQDFLGCSEVGNEMLESKKDSSKSTEIDALESKEIAKMRKSIEYDLLTIMGCTGESTNVWMNNFSQTCEQWSCFAGSDDQPRDPFDLLETYEKTNDNRRKVQNRNIYIRDKAARRIRHLRSGGLSRTFTLAPVNNYLTEEFEDSCKDGKTIFSNSLGQPTQITCTRSAEYSWEHKSSRVTNGYAFKDFEGKKRFQTVLNFLNIFGDQSRNSVSSDISKSSTAELFYDSDPEDGHEEMDASEMRKTLLPMKEVLVASSDEGAVEEREKEGEELRKLEGHDEDEVRDVQLEKQDDSERRIGHKTRQRSLLETFDVESTDMNDGDVVTTLIKELLNSGNLRFVWHPKSVVKSSITINPSPVLVEAWIEMGSCLKSSLIQPKLIWREAHGMKDGGDRELNFQNPHQIDLLNIVRVLIPNSVPRETYPFVKLDCAFLIVSNSDNEYLFEAASREERDRFVHVFKVTVARLASKIIVGDKDVFSEFFSPWGRVKKGSRRQKKKRLSQKIKRTRKQTRAQNNKVYPNNFVSNAVQREGGRKDELWGDISLD